MKNALIIMLFSLLGLYVGLVAQVANDPETDTPECVLPADHATASPAGSLSYTIQPCTDSIPDTVRCNFYRDSTGSVYADTGQFSCHFTKVPSMKDTLYALRVSRYPGRDGFDMTLYFTPFDLASGTVSPRTNIRAQVNGLAYSPFSRQPNHYRIEVKEFEPAPLDYPPRPKRIAVGFQVRLVVDDFMLYQQAPPEWKYINVSGFLVLDDRTPESHTGTPGV